jgi:hypothetical protein
MENQTSLSEQIRVANSVADPGCLSRIPDPKTATKEKGEKIVVLSLYVASTIKN